MYAVKLKKPTDRNQAFTLSPDGSGILFLAPDDSRSARKRYSGQQVQCLKKNLKFMLPKIESEYIYQ